MGYNVEWQSRNDQGAFWRGYNSAKKKDRNYQAGRLAARIEMLRGVLWFVQILIVVGATVIIYKGCSMIAPLG